jgi:hypothetical protein
VVDRSPGLFDLDDRLAERTSPRMTGRGSKTCWIGQTRPATCGRREQGSVERCSMEWRTEGDAAYRSAKNEEMLARRGFVSRLHRKKPAGRPMTERMRIANAQKSKVRSAIEHVFAPEGPDGSLRLHDRDRASPDRAREPLLQHAPLRMAEDEIHGRMTDKAARGAVSKPDQNHKPIKIEPRHDRRDQRRPSPKRKKRFLEVSSSAPAFTEAPTGSRNIASRTTGTSRHRS